MGSSTGEDQATETEEDFDENDLIFDISTGSAIGGVLPTDEEEDLILPSTDKSIKADAPLLIDGVEIDRKDFELGVEPIPLDEFKRLMDSLGPDSMYNEDDLFRSIDDEEDDGDYDDEDESIVEYVKLPH